MTVKAWRWQGIDADGRHRRGVTPSPDSRSLRLHLQRRGIVLENANPLPDWVEWLLKSRTPGVSASQLAGVLRRLSVLVESGIPMIQALEMSGREVRGPLLTVIGAVRDDVATGRSLAEAMTEHPGVFDTLLCGLIRAGEQASALDRLLARIADHRERRERVRQKLRRAMMHPLLVLGIAATVAIMLLGFVMPRFESMFQDFDAELPALTQMLIGASDWLRGGGWLLAAILAGGMTTALAVAMRVPRLRRARDQIILQLPVVGPLIRRIMEARFAGTLALMNEAGMPLADALASLTDSMGNRIYEQALADIAIALDDGRNLEASIASTGQFSETLIQMVAVGEETGQLTAMLNRVAALTEESVNRDLDGLSALAEPVLMTLLGLIIGGLVLAIYLPVFQLGAAI